MLFHKSTSTTAVSFTMWLVAKRLHTNIYRMSVNSPSMLLDGCRLQSHLFYSRGCVLERYRLPMHWPVKASGSPCGVQLCHSSAKGQPLSTCLGGGFGLSIQSEVVGVIGDRPRLSAMLLFYKDHHWNLNAQTPTAQACGSSRAPHPTR